ncbi:hypothetical protein ACHAPT_005122 [Fusarium lateritium]
MVLIRVSSVTVETECVKAVNELRSSRRPDKPKFVILKITDDQQAVVVDETSSEQDYEVFRQKLVSAVDSLGRPAPRYAVYDLRMLYASTMEYLKKAVNLDVFLHADSQDDIEWEAVLNKASGGRV